MKSAWGHSRLGQGDSVTIVSHAVLWKQYKSQANRYTQLLFQKWRSRTYDSGQKIAQFRLLILLLSGDNLIKGNLSPVAMNMV